MVKGYDVSGEVQSDGEPIKAVTFLLYSATIMQEVSVFSGHNLIKDTFHLSQLGHADTKWSTWVVVKGWPNANLRLIICPKHFISHMPLHFANNYIFHLIQEHIVLLISTEHIGSCYIIAGLKGHYLTLEAI